MSVPVWIKDGIKRRRGIEDVKNILRLHNLYTVCEEAKCPNIGECFRKKTATFMILGNICTRNCRFCAIKTGIPKPLDPDEPKNVAAAAKEFGLDYIVVTSVTRDDLPDGGAHHFALTIKEIKKSIVGSRVEVLIPDFLGSFESLQTVINALPDVLNHNVETVPRLYPEVRPLAVYERSLMVLKNAKKINPGIVTKSGIMVGLGEKEREVKEVINDLVDVNCDILTIGQYLQPSIRHFPVREYIHPDIFKKYEEYAYRAGIKFVVSGPLVRSSYRAKEAFLGVKN